MQSWIGQQAGADEWVLQRFDLDVECRPSIPRVLGERIDENPPMQSPDEIFDICDAHDQVIGQARRADVHANNLLHRAVHIWVFRSTGQLVVQLRSATKDQYPNGLTSSASGHLDTGEDYLAAGLRELGEELGLCGVDLQFAVKLPACPETAYEHTALFVITTDAPLRPNVGEVAGLELHSIQELQTLLNQSDGGNLTPPFRQLLEWWLESRL